MVRSFILFLAYLTTSYTQVIDDVNECPVVEVAQNFSLTAYLGTWYQALRYWDSFQRFTKCNTVSYSLAANGSIDIVHQNTYTVLDKFQEFRGVATLGGNGTEGRLIVSYPASSQVIGEYLVLDTDYENWSVVWMCIGASCGGSVRNAWIWTRERRPSDEILDAAVSVLVRYGIDTDLLLTESHLSCAIKPTTLY